MKAHAITSFVGLVLGLAIADTGHTHGGQYRGPEDVVPPGGYGPGGRLPGASGRGGTGPLTPNGTPATSGRPNPFTPGSGNIGAGNRSIGRTGGINLTDDLARWVYWWEFNKDPYIRLRDSLNANRPVTGGADYYMGFGSDDVGVDQVRPTEADIRDHVVPKLLSALDRTDNRDITSACMLALAKIGTKTGDNSLLEVFRRRLTSKDQEIRESAALAMGISRAPGAAADLAALVADSPRGRTLVDRSPVDQRTRAFAAYGLGLLAHGANNISVKRRVFDALRPVVADYRAPGFNLKVAAVQGLRLLNIASTKSPGGRALLDDCVRTLADYYRADLGSGQQLVQAHVPTAIATLLGRDGDADGRFKRMFAATLSPRSKARSVLRQSAALALGDMIKPDDPDDHSAALLDYYRTGKDRQTRYFSLMALAQIGGDANRAALLKVFDRAKHLDRPWAAIALGVLAFHRMDAAAATPDLTLGRALHAALKREASPENRGAIAVALGLSRHRDAGATMRELLRKHAHQDELAGYLCIGLALMNDTESIEQIDALVRTSVRRPERLKQAAIALGKLGDFRVSDTLRSLLAGQDRNVAKLSAVSTAIGFIGDRRSLSPLTDALFDEDLTELSRAFVAVSLGSIGDLNDLPWNTKISSDLNYRAAVETLTNRVSGILDIL